MSGVLTWTLIIIGFVVFIFVSRKARTALDEGKAWPLFGFYGPITLATIVIALIEQNFFWAILAVLWTFVFATSWHMFWKERD